MRRQVQASLSQDPPLQVQAGEVDLPVEPLRGRQRSDLLPLISELAFRPTLGACHDIARGNACDRLGAMLDEGGGDTYVGQRPYYERARPLSQGGSDRPYVQ